MVAIIDYMVQVYKKKNLKISSWNINGYICKGFRKFKDATFLEKLKQNDIFCLQETHCDLKNCLKLPDFPRPVHLIRSKKKNGKRYGGLSVYIRNTIRKGVKFLEHATNDFVWLKLDKTYFGLAEDVFICFAYIPPDNSTYTKKLNFDILEYIENDIAKYSEKGKIMIIGDLNARISLEDDYISDDSDKHLPIFENYKCDFNLISRKSQDHILSPRGKKLLNLCITSSLRVLNGRTFGDLIGSYTCFQPLGSSVVDYFITSEELLPLFTYFTVEKFLPDLSDHCQISGMFKCNINEKLEISNLLPMPEKYIWDENSSSRFQEAMNSNSVKTLINNFVNKDYDESAINNAAEDLNEIFTTAANLSLKKKGFRKSKNQITKPKKMHFKWQDKDISLLKKELLQKYELMQKYNKDPFIRGSFFKCLKEYRKLRRSKIRKHKQDILDKLDHLQENDPKSYWKLLDQLKSESNNPCDNQLEHHISPEKWKDYFENLNSVNNNDHESEIMKMKLKELKKGSSFNELDYIISSEEILKAIKEQ